jgi:hypothetical protein
MVRTVGSVMHNKMIKKLINTPESCVEDACDGVLLSDSNLKKVEGLNILVRADIDKVKAS